MVDGDMYETRETNDSQRTERATWHSVVPSEIEKREPRSSSSSSDDDTTR